MLHQRQPYTCPCCGNSMGSLPPTVAVRKILKGSLRSAFEGIEAAGPDGLQPIELSKLVFGVRAGDDPERVRHLTVLVCKLRKIVEPFGYSIPVYRRGPRRGLYKLIPLEAGA